MKLSDGRIDSRPKTQISLARGGSALPKKALADISWRLEPPLGLICLGGLPSSEDYDITAPVSNLMHDLIPVSSPMHNVVPVSNPMSSLQIALLSWILMVARTMRRLSTFLPGSKLPPLGFGF